MPSRPALIRRARPDDRPSIVAFNAAMALETEGKALDLAVLGRGVEAALADPDRLRYWVAEIDGEVAGQAAITREWSDWRAGWLWWFQSVYVRPDHRGLGLFRALFGQIRDEARADPVVIGLRLYVEEDNARAQSVYRALGLGPGGYQVYEQIWPDRYSTGNRA